MELGLQHVMCDHGIEHPSSDLDSVVAEHKHVVLDVLSDFYGFFVFEDRFEFINNFLRFVTIGRYGNVKSLIFLETEAHSDQFCANRIRSGGFRV